MRVMTRAYRLTRRNLIRVASLAAIGGAGSVIVASCAAQPPTPSPKPAVPTEAPKPAPTTAPPPPTAAAAPAPTATSAPAPQPTAAAAAKPAAAAPAAAAARKVPLSAFYWANDEGDLAIWKEQIALVGQRQPQLEVKFDTATFDNYHDKLLTMAGAGTLPDVIMDNGFRVSSLAARGVTKSLMPYISKESGFDLNDFVKPAQEMGSHKGEIHCLFYDFVGLLPFYNVDLFDAAGVPHPDASWTWDDFTSRMKQLTKTGPDGRVTQAGIVLTKDFVWGLTPFILQNGGELWDKDLKESLLGSPESLEAITFYADLRNKHKVTLAEVPGLGEYTDPFLSKRAAWINHVVAAASGMGPEKGVNWDWGVMPRQKKQVTWAAGSGWAVSGKPKEPDGAWLFVKEITSSPNLTAIAKSQRGYPARYSAMPAYFQGRPKHVEYAKSVMEYARGYPTHPTFLEWWDVLNRELEPALLGSAAPKDVVSKIKPELDNLLAKSRQIGS